MPGAADGATVPEICVTTFTRSENTRQLQTLTTTEIQISTLPAYTTLSINNQLPNQTHFLDQAKLALPFITVYISGLATRALVDTGATHGVMSADVARSLGLARRPTSIQMRNANGGLSRAVGVASAIVGLTELDAVHYTFLLVEDLPMGVILGWDFLLSLGTSTSMTANRISYYNSEGFRQSLPLEGNYII